MIAYVSDQLSGNARSLSSAVFKRVFPFVIIISTGCGGGGGGGGGASIKPPTITAPPPAGTIGASEIGNSPGLNLVAASHLYESGQRGTGNQIAVLDSGVDANHEELTGRTHAVCRAIELGIVPE